MLRSIVSVIQQPGFRLELLNHKLCPSLASLDRLRNGATRAASSAQEAAAGSKPSETASTGENGSTSDGDAAAAHDESFADVDVSQLKVNLHSSTPSQHHTTPARQYSTRLRHISCIIQCSIHSSLVEVPNRVALSIQHNGLLCHWLHTATRICMQALSP